MLNHYSIRADDSENNALVNKMYIPMGFEIIGIEIMMKIIKQHQ